MNRELPQGLRMALANNDTARKAFDSMTDYERNSVIQWARGIHSKQQMQQLVDNMAGGMEG